MRRFDRVVVVGTGEVTEKRARPSLERLKAEGMVRQVTYLDLKPPRFVADLDPEWERFQLVTEQIGATIDRLREDGVLGCGTLVLVNTSSGLHVPYARAFAPHVGRVGVEKPLALSGREAATLLPHEGVVFPLGHQLFKDGMLRLIQEFIDRTPSPANVGAIRFDLLETKGVGERQIDDCVWDLGFHGLELGLAPFAVIGYRPELRIHETRVTTYDQGPDRPRNWTGAFIRGSLLAGMVDIPFEIRVGKGMSPSRKGLRLVDVDGRLWRSVSLDGTSEDPHYRMIRELLTAEKPNLVLSLPQVVDICRACEEAADVAREEERHRFGETPEWLRATNPVLQALS